MNTRNALKGLFGFAVICMSLSFGAASAAEAPGPVLAVISHPVKDYAAWRTEYESAAAIRQKAGVTSAEVFRDSANPNNVVVIHRFKSVAAAKAFLADPELKVVMNKGGVTAAPTSIIATKEEK